MKKLMLSMVTGLAGLLMLVVYFGAQPVYSELPKVQRIEDVVALFPKDKQNLDTLVSQALAEANKGLEKIYAIKERTFDNTVRAFDRIASKFQIAHTIANVLSLVSPDEHVRAAAQEACSRLQDFAVINFSQNKRLFQALSDYKHHLEQDGIFRDKEKLTAQEEYFLKETLDEYQRQGLQLPEEIQKKIIELKKELAKLELAFEMNIAKDVRFIEVTGPELKGLDKAFKKCLEKTKEGKYKIGIDYPTYRKVMEECSVSQTRKKLFKEFSKRGYPANEEVLKKVIALRDKLATILRYPSYARLDIENQMAKTPENVEQFLYSVAGPCEIKAKDEVLLYKKDVGGIPLSADGKFYPWDLGFIKNSYKKKHLAIDESQIAQYFPLEYTLPALLTVYEKFFGLSFKPIDIKGLWHESVIALAVYKDACFIGTVLLDLFPRPHKYSHAAEVSIVPTIRTKNGDFYPAVVLVIANFPAATKTMPSLFKRADVITFFHEFGHAIHSLLGVTELASLSGTAVKNDFVEMPSQMLEEWMWDPEILKMVSKHYKTGEPLSDDLIKKIRALKNFDSGEQALRQLLFAFASLEFFKKGENKDIFGIWKRLHETFSSHVMFDDEERDYCSFGHLMGYGAKYYGYMWSKVFALDLFYYIQKFGLLDNGIGSHYVCKVIGKGGSGDPAEFIRNFLGRKPNSEAFFKDLGISYDSKDTNSSTNLRVLSAHA